MNGTQIISIVLGAVCLGLIISLFVFFSYCNKNTVKWVNEYGKYFSDGKHAAWKTAGNPIGTVFLVILSTIIGIGSGSMTGILIAGAVDIILILNFVNLIRRIAKNKPPMGVFKVIFRMVCINFGISFNLFLKILHLSADVAVELEKNRQIRISSVESYCQQNGIRYKRVNYNGFSYIDENDQKHDVSFY